MATKTVIASPSLSVILSEVKNLVPLRTGSVKQSHLRDCFEVSPLAMTTKQPLQRKGKDISSYPTPTYFLNRGLPLFDPLQLGCCYKLKLLNYF